MQNNQIYMDNASTTRVDKRVLLAMKPFWDKMYANPSNIYSMGLKARDAVEKSRCRIAKFLNAKPNEIIFTSGGSESNNLAIFGVLSKLKKGRIITSVIEHPSVLKPIEALEKRGFEVMKIKPKQNGVVNAEDVKNYLNHNTVLVTIMYANNEIGTIQPIARISKIISSFNAKRQTPNARRIIFHTDACQATQYLDMDVKKLGVDLLTINGSKIHAPKGTGALYVRSGVVCNPQILGGPQEAGLRAGTENLAGIVGLAKAIALINKSDNAELGRIRDYIINELLKIPGSQLNGCKIKRLPNNINISFANVEGESLVLYLDKRGICVSTGSACSSQSLEPSYVVGSIKGKEAAHSSLRISLSRYNTMEEAKAVVFEIKKAVKELRRISENEK